MLAELSHKQDWPYPADFADEDETIACSSLDSCSTTSYHPSEDGATDLGDAECTPDMHDLSNHWAMRKSHTRHLSDASFTIPFTCTTAPHDHTWATSLVPVNDRESGAAVVPWTQDATGIRLRWLIRVRHDDTAAVADDMHQTGVVDVDHVPMTSHRSPLASKKRRVDAAAGPPLPLRLCSARQTGSWCVLKTVYAQVEDGTRRPSSDAPGRRARRIRLGRSTLQRCLELTDGTSSTGLPISPCTRDALLSSVPRQAVQLTLHFVSPPVRCPMTRITPAPTRLHRRCTAGRLVSSPPRTCAKHDGRRAVAEASVAVAVVRKGAQTGSTVAGASLLSSSFSSSSSSSSLCSFSSVLLSSSSSSHRCEGVAPPDRQPHDATTAAAAHTDDEAAHVFTQTEPNSRTCRLSSYDVLCFHGGVSMHRVPLLPNHRYHFSHHHHHHHHGEGEEEEEEDNMDRNACHCRTSSRSIFAHKDGASRQEYEAKKGCADHVTADPIRLSVGPFCTLEVDVGGRCDARGKKRPTTEAAKGTAQRAQTARGGGGGGTRAQHTPRSRRHAGAHCPRDSANGTLAHARPSAKSTHRVNPATRSGGTAAQASARTRCGTEHDAHVCTSDCVPCQTDPPPAAAASANRHRYVSPTTRRKSNTGTVITGGNTHTHSMGTYPCRHNGTRGATRTRGVARHISAPARCSTATMAEVDSIHPSGAIGLDEVTVVYTTGMTVSVALMRACARQRVWLNPPLCYAVWAKVLVIAPPLARSVKLLTVLSHVEAVVGVRWLRDLARGVCKAAVAEAKQAAAGGNEEVTPRRTTRGAVGLCPGGESTRRASLLDARDRKTIPRTTMSAEKANMSVPNTHGPVVSDVSVECDVSGAQTTPCSTTRVTHHRHDSHDHLTSALGTRGAAADARGATRDYSYREPPGRDTIETQNHFSLAHLLALPARVRQELWCEDTFWIHPHATPQDPPWNDMADVLRASGGRIVSAQRVMRRTTAVNVAFAAFAACVETRGGGGSRRVEQLYDTTTAPETGLTHGPCAESTTAAEASACPCVTVVVLPNTRPCAAVWRGVRRAACGRGEHCEEEEEEEEEVCVISSADGAASVERVSDGDTPRVRRRGRTLASHRVRAGRASMRGMHAAEIGEQRSVMRLSPRCIFVTPDDVFRSVLQHRRLTQSTMTVPLNIVQLMKQQC